MCGSRGLAVTDSLPVASLSLQLYTLRKQAFYQDALLWIHTCYYLFDFSCSSH